MNNGPDARQNVRIPTQRVMTVLWSHHWQRSLSGTWKDNPQNMKEQLALHKPQRIPLWDKDSILRSEFGEPDQGDASQQRYLWWKPMAWLGIIRPTNQSEKWHMQQWSTFFCLTLGVEGLPWVPDRPTLGSRFFSGLCQVPAHKMVSGGFPRVFRFPQLLL